MLQTEPLESDIFQTNIDAFYQFFAFLAKFEMFQE